MNEKMKPAKLIWTITYAHTIAYFFAGIFAMSFMQYPTLLGSGYWSFMRPTTDPIIALGPALQLLRGLLLALVLWPLRKAFFEEKRGLLHLCIITVGFCYLLTFGAAPGSFEGYIYTILPVRDQLLGIPEMVLYVSLFIGILYFAKKYAHRNIMSIAAAIIILAIGFMSIAGYIAMSSQI